MPTELARRIEGRILTCRAHGPEAEKAISGRWTPIAAEFEALEREKVRIQENHELTAAGRQAALAALANGPASKVLARLAAIGEELRSFLAGLLGDENAANQGLRKDPSGSGGYLKDTTLERLERTPEVLMLEREIRDRLQGTDLREVQGKYLLAVVNDDDRVFVSSVEYAPKMFPLVGEETLAQAREIRIARSPWAETIYLKRALYDADALLLEMAFSELCSAFPSLPTRRPALPRREEAPRPPLGVEKAVEAVREAAGSRR
jgi:hypothetical protein